MPGRARTCSILSSLAALLVVSCELTACHPQTEPHPTTRAEAFEELPSWRCPDIVLTEVVASAERVSPEENVTFTAAVANRGPAAAREVVVAFFVDGRKIARGEIGQLGASGHESVRATWRAAGPGRHSVRVLVTHAGPFQTFGGADNWAESAVWVAGEEHPVPELQVRTIDFRSSPLAGKGPIVLPFWVHNPSFATIRSGPIRFSLDGVLLSEGVVRPLEPGETQQFEVRWSEVRPGQHLLRAEFDRAGEPPPHELPAPRGGPREPGSQPLPPPPGGCSWALSIPGPTTLYAYPAGTGQWASMGPSILLDGNAGRMEDLVFDTQDERVAYGVTEVGGIWKTSDFGGRWTPIGDKLPTMNFFRVAVDPNHPKVVYAATQNDGLWKSIDGGDSWSPFAVGHNDIRMPGVRALIVRHRSVEHDQVVVYVGCDLGLLEYVSTDPFALQSQSSEWTKLIGDPVWDVAVHPNNPSMLWAAVNKWVSPREQQLDRVVVRQGAASPWQVAQGLPGQGLAKLDVSSLVPSVLYAAVWSPAPGKELAVYRSIDSGLNWRFICDYPANNGDYWKVMYNPFVRIDPSNPLVIYVAGTQLYRVDVNKALTNQSDHTRVVDAGHPDIKELVFLKSLMPSRQGQAFWVLSDGGVWHVPDLSSKIHRNGELRNIQFYDLAASATDPNLMLGGTQDNGTLRFRGYHIWQDIGPKGDGEYSLVSPKSNRMYAQEQSLDSLHRTDNGLDKKPGWRPVPGSGSNSLPKDVSEGVITMDPGDDSHVLAVGDQVYETKNAGGDWLKMGPDTSVRGSVSRVLFRPGTDSNTWMAGTSEGQIWYHTKRGWLGSHEHTDAKGMPDLAAVKSMAFSASDSRVLWVVFASGARDRRIYRYENSGGTYWAEVAISDWFPANVTPTVICGDPHSTDVVYVGTDNGVYRGQTFNNLDYVWAPYNEGFPLVKVTTLLVDNVSRELRAGTNGRGAWAVRTR